MDPDFLKRFSTWYHSHEKQIIEDFCTFLRFKSISADPRYKDEIQKTAKWLESYLTQRGFSVEILQTSHQPVVFAKRMSSSSSAKTLMFYGHFDVQPVDPIELWSSSPFEPRIEEGKIYARGAVDNKGQMFYMIVALAAFIEAYPDAAINLKVFIEGEEESGGVGTEEALKIYKEKFAADELYVVDFDIKGKNRPTLSLGARGILTCEVTLCNAKGDLHSGMHGGIAFNPLRALTSMLASLWDQEGRIAIEGFYDNIPSLSKEERKEIDFSFDLKSYSEEFGVGAFAMEKGLLATESNWLYPCLEINGICGGYAGEGFKTVLPAKAIAKLSCRLVPGQDPQRLVEKIEHHLRSHLPQGMQMEFFVHHFAKAFGTKQSYACVQAAKKAMEEVFNTNCHFVLCGASVPILPAIQEATGAEVCLLGLGLETDNIHAPNEHFDLERFYKGFLIICSLLYKKINAI